MSTYLWPDEGLLLVAPTFDDAMTTYADAHGIGLDAAPWPVLVPEEDAW